MRRLRELLAKNPDLRRVAAAIVEQASTCLNLSATPMSDESIEIAATKLGGAPDLPSVTPWPSRERTPLSFIAQINVATLPNFSGLPHLPARTLLSFFYDTEQAPWGFDPNDKGSWQVLASPLSSGVPLNRRALPGLIPDDGRFRSCVVSMTEAVSLPDPFSLIVEKLHFTEQERRSYFDLFRQFSGTEAEGEHHQLLGHADQIQNDMQLECQLASNGIYCGDAKGWADPRRHTLESDADKWKLLLQVDTDENTGMQWGDSGRLYYWIKENSLRSGSFDNVWLVLQCY
jgi:uncharacterized protein YwqG